MGGKTEPKLGITPSYTFTVSLLVFLGYIRPYTFKAPNFGYRLIFSEHTFLRSHILTAVPWKGGSQSM